MKLFLLVLLSVVYFAGCLGNRPAPAPDVLTMEPPAFIVRVQSSYGDLQQVEVSVIAWLFNGEEHRQFDKKTTPFDIPIAPGDFFLQLRGPQGAPTIKMQLLKGDNGMMAGYVQSNEVCVRGDAGGGFEVMNCMAGLR